MNRYHIITVAEVRVNEMVKVQSLTEEEIEKIGEAFADFEYAEGERGIAAYYKNRDAVKDYICDYTRAALKADRLFSTSERHEAFITYRYSEDKMSIAAGWMIIKSFFRTMGFSNALRFAKKVSAAGESYGDKLKKEQKPYVAVGMLAVTKEYQGQGYMRKVLELAYDEGRKHRCPVVLDTDAALKRDKYVRLGMKCVGERKVEEGSCFYDLVWEDEQSKE